jgi:hypothetical protein
MLRIEIGTQSISPLAWSSESGSLESSSAMIKDLLTFRADWDRYYYAVGDLFTHHFNTMQMLLNDAQAFTTELLDGLIKRLRVTLNGNRPTNYFIEPLVIDLESTLTKTFDWIGRSRS